MNELLQRFGTSGGDVLWGVAPWRLGLAVLIIFVGFASRRVIQAVFARLAHKAHDSNVKWDDEATRLLAKPLAIVVQILLWMVAATLMLLPTSPFNTRLLIAQGLEAALMFAVIWVFFRVVDVLASVVERLAEKTQTRIDDQAVPLLRKTLKVFLAVLGFVFIIQNLGFSVLSVLTGLGIGGLALALAAQDSVANFFGSLVLFTDAPFQVEDYVEVNGVCGTVEEVGFRTTRIRKDDSSIVCVPNQTFTSSFITNLSERQGRVISFAFRIAPPDEPGRLHAFLTSIRAALAENDQIRPESIEAYMTGFEESALAVSIRALTKYNGWTEFLKTREEAFFDVLSFLHQHDLRIAVAHEVVLMQPGVNGHGLVASEPQRFADQNGAEPPSPDNLA